jgi:hypothetical protein
MKFTGFTWKHHTNASGLMFCATTSAQLCNWLNNAAICGQTDWVRLAFRHPKWLRQIEDRQQCRPLLLTLEKIKSAGADFQNLTEAIDTVSIDSFLDLSTVEYRTVNKVQKAINTIMIVTSSVL